MRSVGTLIFERPRPLSRQRRANHLYTLICEEPIRHSTAGSPLKIHLAGPAATVADLTVAGEKDRMPIEIAIAVLVLLVLLVVYIGSTGWTIWMSLTSSRMLPNNTFVGLRQYEILFSNDRWLTSVHNLVLFGVLFATSAHAAIVRRLRHNRGL